MIIIGILAATMLPRIDFGTTSSTCSVDGAGYMIASDIPNQIDFGILFKQRDRRENEIESYQKAPAIDPHHRKTHYNMTLLYEQLENWELAISRYQQFIKLSSKQKRARDHSPLL